MQLSEKELVERALDALAGNPVGTRNIVETSVRIVLEALRAQADARPVAEWQVRYMGDPRQPGIWSRSNNPDWCERQYKAIGSASDSKGYQVRPLYTHPEASAGLRVFFNKEELDALYEAIEWAKDEGLPGTAEHLQAIFDAHDPEASAPGLSDDAKDLLSAMGFRLVDDFYLRGDVPDDSEESWEVVHRDTVAALSAGAAQLDDDAVYTVLRNYDADMTRKTAEAIAHDLRLTRASAATVAEPGESEKKIERLIRALKMIAKPLHPDADLSLAIKTIQGMAEGAIAALSNAKLAALHDQIDDLLGQFKSPAKAAQQQAEPGADEREAFRQLLNEFAYLQREIGKHGHTQKLTTQSNAVYEKLEAAQSGQRAGVAEGLRLVPVEPTDEWCRELAKKAYGSGFVGERATLRFCLNVIRDVLAAAPTHHTDQS